MFCFQPSHVQTNVLFGIVKFSCCMSWKIITTQSVFHNEVSHELSNSAICYRLGKYQIRDTSRVVGNDLYFLNTDKRNHFYGLGVGRQSQSQEPLFQR